MNIIQPKVNVIINCFNDDKFLFDAIQSVINQSYLNWEIIFWDNASTVNIKSIALSFGDPRIRYHRACKNTPLGEARNMAIAQVDGDYIAFLDSDDLWAKDKLSKQVEQFQKNKKAVLVYTDVESFNSSGDVRRLGHYKKFHRGDIFGELLIDYFLVMSSVMIRAKTYLDNHIHFNERFNMVEECDVFMRMALYGEVDYIDQVLSYWRVHKNSITWKNYNLISEESELMINLLLDEFPRLREIYNKQLDIKQSWILRQKILGFWMSGQGHKARSAIMKNWKRLSFKVKIFYLVTWFKPRVIVRWLFYFFGSTVTPG